MEDQAEHYRHLMLFYYRKGKNATETCRKICHVYGENAVTERVCQKWFARFRKGNFSVRDAPRSGRPKMIDSDQMKAVVEQDCRLTTREIADILKISKSSVENELHKLGYVSKLDVWVPHKLTEANLVQKVSICDIVAETGKQWAIFWNELLLEMKSGLFTVMWHAKDRGKRQVIHHKEHPKQASIQKKWLLSIWWDWKGVIFFELLSPNRTINSAVYCEQLDKLSVAV